MRSFFIITCFILLCIAGLSCKKEVGCKNCLENPGEDGPPIQVSNTTIYAGADQVIELPLNHTMLSGVSSKDPSGRLFSYRWTKKTGPDSGSIRHPDSLSSAIQNLELGEYIFELRMTYTDGILTDDVKIKVINNPVIPSCGQREEIKALLVPIGNLSVARVNLVAAASGDYILFAGGWIPGSHSTRVDILNITTNTWTTAELSEPLRDGMAVANVGDKILFAGGGNNDWVDVTSRVDIFNSRTYSWSQAELSEPRNSLAAATLGNKVFFAGGGIWGPIGGSAEFYHIGTTTVDIYDNLTNTWSNARLSVPRFELTATAVGSKIYFAGGLLNNFQCSDRIDIYNELTGEWSISQLAEPKASHTGFALGNRVFWCSGSKNSYNEGYHRSSLVEVRDITTNTSSFECMLPKVHFKTIQKNNMIVHFTGMDLTKTFDIYNTSTGSWSIGSLPFPLKGAAIISANNEIYVAGGWINGVYSDQVWKLEF